MSSENKAVQIVNDFLAASMAPDPVKAATYMSSDVRITFTGGRVMPSATEITAFNAEHADYTVVYSNGTLYGEWPDGSSFSGNRYLDRFEVRDGKITRMDVWNDSAEWILAPEVAKP